MDKLMSDKQHRMAAYLNLHPDSTDKHLYTIDRLIALEEHEGKEAMLTEIIKMMNPR